MRNVVFAVIAMLGLVLSATSLITPSKAYVYLHQPNEHEGANN